MVGTQEEDRLIRREAAEEALETRASLVGIRTVMKGVVEGKDVAHTAVRLCHRHA